MHYEQFNFGGIPITAPVQDYYPDYSVNPYYGYAPAQYPVSPMKPMVQPYYPKNCVPSMDRMTKCSDML